MPTATYNDFIVRHPGSTASQETIEAFIEDVAAEIAARCDDRGTTYEEVAGKRESLLRRIECAAVFRMCGRTSVGGVEQNGLQSFSQTVGDHTWNYSYPTGNGKDLLLDDEWKALGLAGQQIGWLAVPASGGRQ